MQETCLTRESFTFAAIQSRWLFVSAVALDEKLGNCTLVLRIKAGVGVGVGFGDPVGAGVGDAVGVGVGATVGATVGETDGVCGAGFGCPWPF